MIDFLRGILESKSMDSAVLDVSGVGYKVFIPNSTNEKLTGIGREAKLFIVESVAMYGGSTAYYGFLTEDERDIFSLLKDEVPGAGAKKALEYMDKATKSLPDFKKAVVTKDAGMLTGIFGFSKKTAEKILSSLKDKIHEINISGPEKWVQPQESVPLNEAVAGLIALGYKEIHARQAVEKILNTEEGLSVEDVIKQALRAI